MKTVLVTGGCGFIGSNFLNLFVPQMTDTGFVNIDSLTYAGNPLNLKDIEDRENYRFERVDIRDQEAVDRVFKKYMPDTVVHFAAESHVDRSIYGPRDFLETNVTGTLNLLEACRSHWNLDGDNLFHHVSTDEVYGSLGDEGLFTETTPYDPSSPYSASKASSDHLVRAWHRTFGLQVTITNCSNNYGPYQFPEKLIPLMILNALEGKQLPVYGRGLNVRDWLYVTDHCRAVMKVIENGQRGGTYNIGGNCEKRNIEIVQKICDLVAGRTGKDAEHYRGLISYVKDRPGHDYRYAMDASKIEKELGFRPQESFESGLEKTVDWYMGNTGWVESVRTGEYRKWIESHYGDGDT